MTHSFQNATPPISSTSRNSNSSVQIRIKPTAQFEFVLRDTEESEFHNLVDFGGSFLSGNCDTHVCLNIHMCVWIEPYDTDKHFEKPATYMCVCVCVCVRVSKKNPPTCVFVWKEPCNTHENSEKSPTIHMHVWKEPYNTQVCLKRTNEPLNTHAYSENSP